MNTCRLPDWYERATDEDRVKLELNCTIVNAADARKCAAAKAQCAKDLQDLQQ